MYIYRRLEHGDLQAICTFPQSEQELYYMSPRSVYPLTASQILQLLEQRLEPTVVIDKNTGEVVGYSNIYSYDREAKTCWLGNVIVSPVYRGQGAASYLLDVMLEQAKHNLGVDIIRLACHNTNSRGLAFYTKYGFKPYDIKITNVEEKKLLTIHMAMALN